MRKEDLNKLLDGEQNPEQIDTELPENSIEMDFMSSYQQVINQKNSDVPDFNPFEKIKLEKKKNRKLITWRIMPYAASVALLISLFFALNLRQTKPGNSTITAQEITTVQQNTEVALLQFSKELNTCLVKLEDLGKIRQPIIEIIALKHINIESNNPLKNIKIN